MCQHSNMKTKTVKKKRGCPCKPEIVENNNAAYFHVHKSKKKLH